VPFPLAKSGIVPYLNATVFIAEKDMLALLANQHVIIIILIVIQLI
jgi:hypothetical protein